jgi:hypothetical protein
VSFWTRLLRIWLVSIVSAYVGFVGITIRDRDPRIDPHAQPPFAVTLLGFYDPIVAFVEGTVIAVIVIAMIAVLGRSKRTSVAMVDRWALALPPLAAFLIMMAQLIFTNSGSLLRCDPI